MAAGLLRLELIELLFLLGPLVLVPLGLRVARRHEGGQVSPALDRFAGRLQPLGALLAAGSFFLISGWTSAGMAAAWLVVSLLIALPAGLRVLRGPLPTTAEACFLLARLYLPVGGVWLVLSRLGATPMGFAEPIVLLTAVHFHFAGFAAALIAGATARAMLSARGALSWPVRWTLWVVIAGPGLLAAGFVISPALRMVFALLLALGLLSFTGILAASVRFVPNLPGRAMLSVSAAALSFAMILVGIYAVGEFTGDYWLLIPQMARWHGVVNALGFSLCGLLAWQQTGSTEAAS